MKFRHIVQITTTMVPNNQKSQCDWVLYALCSDGTVWEKPDSADWAQVDTKSITDSA